MELKLGQMTNQELAQWFDITVKSFTNTKKKRLEELKYFADFYENKGKVVITKIINPVYSKRVTTNYEKVKDKIDEVWSSDGLDTCTRVGNEIYEQLTKEDNDFNLQDTTVIAYTRKGRNELYGRPFVGGGQIGNCIYLWCKRDRKTGRYSFLTPEEQEIKQKLQTKYFGDATEKQILVKGMIESGEISKEEAWQVLEELTNMNTGNFMGFLSELQAILGCQVIKGTLVNRDNNLLEIKEGEFELR